MLHERSAGAVVFYCEGKCIEYLLLLYGAGHWDFPKGNIEEGEEEVETVRREIFEETGIKNIAFVSGFRHEIRYFYRKMGDVVNKKVVFYLVRSYEKEVRLSSEHKDYVWLDYENSLKRLTYNTAKETLIRAHDFLKSIGGCP
ncbi:MAG: NUDIX domain-containing protein [Thaumarchaeota archaeon]|jgi:8-oxo-dGTP pyrophosphatase MutT (NUDIX family)|nr:NUDIX domain-containing protein [Candidatus Terraquivivens yellowstonensis]